MRLSVFALGLMFLLPAQAATVEVLVRERKAGPIADQRVVLQPLLAPGALPTWDRMRGKSGVTGVNGKVVFDGVSVGRYTVGLDRISDSGLINPAANSLAPPPEITIGAEGDKVSVELEVWRGSLLSSEIIMDRPSVPRGAKLVMRSLDGQPDVDLALDIQGRVERVMLPGRYELELVAPPGYLLVDVVWNGESLPGHVVRFDVREDTRRQNVSWYLSAPCLVTGKIEDASGQCPARVVATLVEPGPWIQAATQRGGSTFQVVPHQEWDEHQKCVYRLWLPEGRWIVQPQGDALVGSDPESADVTIAPNETRSLDFELITKDGDDSAKRAPLIVAVRSPEGRPLAGSIVEIWPPGGGSAPDKPLATGRTEGYGGSVPLRGLAAGDYLAGAGREEFLEGTARVEGYDPQAKEPKSVTVRLREGAKLHAHALDEKDHSVQGVELTYTRLSPLPTMTLVNEGIVSKKRGGSARTDLTGHVEIPGLYSGDYRLEARMTGEQSATRFVLLRQGQAKHTRSIEVTLTEGLRSDVDLLVLPAASLSGGLVCSDRGTMPPKASFRVFPADSPVEGLWRDRDLVSGAAITPNDVLLGGAQADQFHLGPLPPGEYRLAARPDGQRYWSWVLNELVPDRAAIFPAVEIAAVDTGLVEIECGPVVAVVPELKSKEPVPDMRLGAVHVSLRPMVEEKIPPRASANVELQTDHVFLRRLPEGKFKTALTVEHPYLIPATVPVAEQVLDLTRGSMAEIRVAFDRLGGLVEVRGAGKVARLRPEVGPMVMSPVENGKSSFPGTNPGTYSVELCTDPECATVSATWRDVAVLAGRTTFVP